MSSAPRSVAGDSSLTQYSVDSFAARAEEALRHDGKGLVVSTAQLFGRESELRTLREAIADALDCSTEETEGKRKRRPRVVSITGAAGSGKSSLARTAHNTKPEQQRGGGEHYVCTGKFAPGGETGLARCMEDLVRQVVDRDWDMGIRRRLQESIQPCDAAVLVEVFPSLGLLLGGSEEDDPADSAAATDATKLRRANKRQFLFLHLIRALSKHLVDQYYDEDRDDYREDCNTGAVEVVPLVLVLEDLHWVDPATMELVSAMVRDPELPNFLLVTTSRPPDPDSAKTNNTFVNELERWKELNLRIESIHLNNLNQAEVHRLVACLLDSDDLDSTAPLADCIYEKTQGHPLFVTELLKKLVELKLVKYNFLELEWTFDIPRIRSVGAADNAGDLLKEKVKGMPCRHQVILLIAACLPGSVNFSASFLERVLLGIDTTGIIPSTTTTAIDLHDISVVGILQACVAEYGVLNCSKDGTTYYFVHDLVKDAALAFGGEGERRMLLKSRVGKYILSKMPNDSAKKNNDGSLLFGGVDLCNEASALLDPNSSSEWLDLVNYNLLAGQKAMSGSMFALALEYMETGIKYIECHAKSEFDEGSALAINLLAGAAEAVYCVGYYDKICSYADRVVQLPNCSTETRVQMMYFQILSKSALEQNKEALCIGHKAIELLGLAKFPVNPGVPSILIELMKTKKLLRKHTEESLLALPRMEDKNRINSMRIVQVLQIPAFVACPSFFMVTLFKTLRWSIKYGISIYSPVIFATYGFIQFAAFGDSKANNLFTEVALKLADKLNAKETISKTSMMCFAFCRPWSTDMRTCYEPIVYAHKLAMEVGDTETALQNLLYMAILSWVSAVHPLPILGQNLYNYTVYCAEHKQKAISEGLTWMAGNLRRLCSHDDDSFAWLDAPAIEKLKSEKAHDAAIQTFYDCVRLQTHYLLGESKEALEIAKKTAGVGVKDAPGAPYACQTHFYRGLVFLNEASEGRKKRTNLRAAKQSMALLQKWITGGDINSIHMLRLLEAEEAKVKGKPKQAKDLYTEAIRIARKMRQSHDVGVCLECEARFYQQEEDNGRAAHHIEESINSFREWGAGAKEQQLTKTYSDLLSEHGSTTASFASRR